MEYAGLSINEGGRNGMKKKRKWIVVAVAIACLYGIAFAADGIVDIAVNYDTVKQIVVNHEEVALPEGEEPFEYNGRTYVPLRFVSEALGKQVGWDGYNGIVSIVDGIPRGELVFENDLSSEEDRKIRDQRKSTGSFLVKDGAFWSNSYYISYLSLRPEYCPLPMSKFTIEVDIMLRPDEEVGGRSVCAGVMIGQRAQDLKYDDGSGLSVIVEPDENTDVPYVNKWKIIAIPCNQFVTFTVVFDEDKEANKTFIDSYVDGKLMQEGCRDMTIEQILSFRNTTFDTIGICASNTGAYFKNLKIYCNE